MVKTEGGRGRHHDDRLFKISIFCPKKLPICWIQPTIVLLRYTNFRGELNYITDGRAMATLPLMLISSIIRAIWALVRLYHLTQNPSAACCLWFIHCVSPIAPSNIAILEKSRWQRRLAVMTTYTQPATTNRKHNRPLRPYHLFCPTMITHRLL